MPTSKRVSRSTGAKGRLARQAIRRGQVKNRLSCTSAAHRRQLFTLRYVDPRLDNSVAVLDRLTYAGNFANLEELQSHPRYRFVRDDIADRSAAEPLIAERGAAFTSPGRRSSTRNIRGNGDFVHIDVPGTRQMPIVARAPWWRPNKSCVYRAYYERNYGDRTKLGIGN